MWEFERKLSHIASDGGVFPRLLRSLNLTDREARGLGEGRCIGRAWLSGLGCSGRVERSSGNGEAQNSRSIGFLSLSICIWSRLNVPSSTFLFLYVH